MASNIRFSSATQYGIVLHSDYSVIIALFSLHCKVFSTKKVKILWKNGTKFLKKSFFSLFFCSSHALFCAAFQGFSYVVSFYV